MKRGIAIALPPNDGGAGECREVRGAAADVPERLDENLARWQKALERARGARIVTYHETFNYTHKGHVPRSSDKVILTSWLLFQRAEVRFPDA